MNKKTIKIKLKDVQEFYDFYSPNLSELIIVGNVKKDVIYSKLNFLKVGRTKILACHPNLNFPTVAKNRIYLKDIEGSTQSLILMGHRSNSFDVNDKFFKSQVMNKSLGGGASGRLFLKLRR